MKIQILLFAHLREAAGFDQTSLELEIGSTVRDAAQFVLKAGLEPFRSASVRFALNENFVSEEACLSEGDRLAFIPPVAGG